MSTNSWQSAMPDEPGPTERPLLVLALGGNALSPPVSAGDDYAVERQIVGRTAEKLNRIVSQGYRLLIVHGNGPQVGRLLRQDPAHRNLDIHIAQTQGELGYLLAAAIDEPTVCILTHVVVDADAGPPVKPIGPVLDACPIDAASTPTGAGWRLIVPSPRPIQVIEQEVIAASLLHHHVVAGGGGGVPRSPTGEPVEGVVDKDWVASLLAVALAAAHLIFATDVSGVYEHSDQQEGEPISVLSPAAAHALIDSGAAGPGSMAPKLESAADFASATGRAAHICGIDDIEQAMAGTAGTRVV
jgi:carbamate kinase